MQLSLSSTAWTIIQISSDDRKSLGCGGQHASAVTSSPTFPIILHVRRKRDSERISSVRNTTAADRMEGRKGRKVGRKESGGRRGRRWRKGMEVKGEGTGREGGK